MVPALLLYVSLVNDVRTLIARNDLANAERETRAYQAQVGPTPELAAALSWISRGAFDAGKLDQAEAYAAQARTVADRFLGARRVDADPWLPTAIGAAIEVHAGVLAGRGERPEALAYLREQLRLFRGTSIAERIRKNVNLLDLAGKPAPPLDESDWIGAKPPAFASLRGHPVLLFFWAHWCGDCKAEAPVIADLQRIYGPKGLVLIAPTKLYGYVTGGEEASPAAEKRYIEEVHKRYYPGLEAVPVSAANFLAYGASSTPTIVLIDAAGVVRFYHPGALSGSELSARIQTVMKK